MSSYTRDYICPKSKWDPDLIKYIGLDNKKKYYKIYILQCLLNKLKNIFGKYELDENLIKLLREKRLWQDYHIFVTNYMSKYTLNHIISKFIIEFDHENYYTTCFDEIGKDISNIEL